MPVLTAQKDRIPEIDIQEAVIDTIQIYAQYAVSIDRLLQTRQEQRRRTANRRSAACNGQLRAGKPSLTSGCKTSGERLVEGENPREELRAQKKASDRRKRKFPHGLGAGCKISGSNDNGNAVIEQFKELCRDYGADQRNLNRAAAIRHHLPDGRMDIRLNLTDEIESLLETLRRGVLYGVNLSPFCTAADDGYSGTNLTARTGNACFRHD